MGQYLCSAGRRGLCKGVPFKSPIWLLSNCGALMFRLGNLKIGNILAGGGFLNSWIFWIIGGRGLPRARIISIHNLQTYKILTHFRFEQVLNLKSGRVVYKHPPHLLTPPPLSQPSAYGRGQDNGYYVPYILSPPSGRSLSQGGLRKEPPRRVGPNAWEIPARVIILKFINLGKYLEILNINIWQPNVANIGPPSSIGALWAPQPFRI